MATDRNPDVMEMVEQELRENPDVSNKDLKLKAEEIDEEIEDLSARQFNARYPLQVKRKLASDEAERTQEGAEAAEDDDGAEAEDEDRQPSDEARQEVFSMIEEALEEDPDVSNDELQERAAEIEPSIADLSARSFHARYPLQVKRQMTSARKKEEAPEEGETESASRDELRASVRQALLDFARDVAGASDRGDVIDVLTSVDQYVDRVMEQA
ncbi:MAG: hypothetical protein Q8W44_00765 [Candidatus Palauibacterales bacterium]|nr:hypothetical protein [Candidatus Palauibacterales bacterium]